MNHVGTVYGAIGDVMEFASTFKEFPPRSIPPSFNPTTIMQQTLEDIKLQQKLAEHEKMTQSQQTKKK